MMSEEIKMQIVNECEASSVPAAVASASRKEKRKAAKKEKRKQKRQEEAEKERQEEEARLKDPEEKRRIQLEEEREKERLERERREFEERERLFLEALARKQAQEEEEQRRALIEEEEQKLKENQVGQDAEVNGDDEWEYVEEGPPEIIWRGNEIIVKKNKVRVKKKGADEQMAKEDPDRPTSNPLPPQSEAFADYKNASMVSAQQLLENVAQQTPNFGTEQDKAHCPFHLKTGACRFGSRCSRVHFYPDKSCTLLIKNMYNGPGLAWEQDEGLEYTEEEVEHSYEEFYEDVHTEFLKFGEIVNFKVCRNGSYHLRGNVYVHYKSMDSAILAYSSINGRYFAGKQVTCEFVGVTRWKIAICGEYMKSKLKMCSRGTACNFIHCFRNPGGDYEWADWDKPPPRSWVRKMAALFGYSDQSAYDRQIEEETPKQNRDSNKRLMTARERYRYQRSQSKDIECSKRISIDHYEEDNVRGTKYRQRYASNDAKRPKILDEIQGEEETGCRNHQPGKKRSYDSDSDRDWSERDRDADVHHGSTLKNSRCRQNKRLESYDCLETLSRGDYREKSSRQQEVSSGIMDNFEHRKQRSDSTDRASLSPDEDKYQRRTYNSDSLGEWSDGITENCRMHRRKSLRHLNEDSGMSDDYRESETISGDEYHQKKYQHAKSKAHRVRGVKGNFSRENSEVDFPNEHLIKTDEGHVNENCFQYGWRSKSYESGMSLYSGETGSPESEQVLPKSPKKHEEKLGSDETFGSRIMSHNDVESKLHDSRGHLDEDIDRRGRWEPENFDSGNEQKYIRKSDSNDCKQPRNESGSHGLSSDEYFKASRSRGISESSKRKHEGNWRDHEQKRHEKKTKS